MPFEPFRRRFAAALLTVHWMLTAAMFLIALTSVTAAAVPVEQDAVDRDYSDELPSSDPTEIADTAATFQIVPGFELQLVASEPLLTDPVAATFDEFGRLYVVEMRGYSEDDQLHISRVSRLEDRDHDGRFEHSQIFVDGLDWPTGIACWKGGVIVAQPPDVVYYQDTDNDGRADAQRTLYHGFGRDNVQGMINSFRWGPDNRLYGTSSSNGGDIENVAHQGAPLQLRRRDFRIDPRDWSMEAIPGGGQHGMTFDRWGDRFVCSNSNHLQWVSYEQQDLDRHPALADQGVVKSIATDGESAEVFRISPVEPWRIVRTRLRLKGLVPGPVEGGGRAAGYFTSATGLTMYQGDAYGKPFQTGQFAFVGDVGGNLIHLKEIRNEGLERFGYRVHEAREFIASNDNWFRPVQMEHGPDGTLFVLDMYREVIEHPHSLPPVIKQHLDLTRGRDRGRIYRIAPEGFQTPQRRLPGHANPLELCRMLDHDNSWHRETAARLILQDPTDIHRDELKRLMQSAEHPEGRMRILYLLADLQALDVAEMQLALGDSDPQVRCHALKLLRRDSESLVDRSLIQSLAQLAQDGDARVQYQLALSLRVVPRDIRTTLWMQLARTAPDSPRMRVALLDGAAIDPGDALDALGQLEGERPPQVDALATELVKRVGEARSGKAIVKILRSSPPGDPFGQVAELLLATGLDQSTLIPLLESGGLDDATTFVTQILADARARIVDQSGSIEQRVQAIELVALANGESDVAFWNSLLSAEQPTALRTAAIRALPASCPQSGADLLLSAIPRLLPNERQLAWDVVLGRTAWLPHLFAHLQDETLLPQDLAMAHRDRLLRHQDAVVQKQAAHWFSPPQDRVQVQQQYATVLQMEGDMERGKQVFTRVCITCHKMEGKGADVGPDLIGARRKGAEYLLANVLDPNREVDARYEGYAIETVDGRVLTGIIVAQSNTAVTLRRPEGIEERLPLAEIETLRASGRSLMPEGLETDITVQQMADLIAYLAHDVAIDK